MLLFVVSVRTVSHVRHVGLISNRLDAEALGSRHRRQVEIPYPPAEAFEMVDGAIRELPHVESVESLADSLQVRAQTKRKNPSGNRNRVHATVTPGEGTSSLVFICEPAVFKQIHRSTIVNMKAVASITRDESGRGTLRLKHRSETLPVSLSFMTLFRNM